MKAMKKLLPMILAVAFSMVAFTGVAFASSVTMDITEGDTHEYKVYQIYTGELADGVLSNIKYGNSGYGTQGESVPQSETDGITDTQWVWFNRTIDLEPRRFVVYETYDRASTNKVEWVDWTNAVTVTHNGRTWEGCHVCTVTRPEWAQGGACLDKPNDTFGGLGGMDFGDLLLTCGNVPLYTGFVTNGVTGQVLYFDNGFNKGTPE